MDPDILQRFVESVGQKADVDLYLKLFRSQRKESFAIIVADAQIVRAALDPFHFDLRILAGLGLYPVVLVGLLDARDADKQSQRILEWLLEDEVSAKVIGSGTDLPQEIQTSVRQSLEENTIPIVSLDAAKELAIDDRFRLLRTLAASLESRKIIFLSTHSGKRPLGFCGLAPVIPLRERPSLDALCASVMDSDSGWHPLAKLAEHRCTSRRGITVRPRAELAAETATKAKAQTNQHEESIEQTTATCWGCSKGRETATEDTGACGVCTQRNAWLGGNDWNRAIGRAIVAHHARLIFSTAHQFAGIIRTLPSRIQAKLASWTRTRRAGRRTAGACRDITVEVAVAGR
jgi:hypothetical protein